MPPIVSFLVTGILVGPSGLGLMSDAQVEGLSELGVILLLFTIGLEFSIQNLLKIKRLVLLGGSLQMLAGLVIITPIALIAGFRLNQSIVLALLLTLSSTAIVLKIFQDRGEMGSAHGRGGFAVLIFQDLAVVPIMVFLPMLAGTEGGDPIYMVALKVVAVMAIVVVLAIWIVPRIMKRVAQTKSNELFMFTVALVCLGTAFLTDKAGLSLALGAFMAGMVLAGSPYAYQAIGSVMPMRDIFTSLFFISIGLKMNVGLLVQKPATTVGLALAVMLINVLATSLAMKITGLTKRVAFLIGFSLCQIGEFSFVLISHAYDLKLFDSTHMEMFLNIAVLTMAMTPLALGLGRSISHHLADLSKSTLQVPKIEATDHAIVVGFGVAGQGVARACRLINRQYAIIDLNPSSVENFQKLGEPIVYGDAVNEHVLEHTGIHRAAMLVLSIPDPLATRRIIVLAKSMNPKIYILARTRFLLTKEILIGLGADSVVAEEFEAAIKVFDSVMSFYQVPEEEKQRWLHEARESGPSNFRNPKVAEVEEVIGNLALH
jgi:CPA2 family monovalent cation:H+ antiporter-2